MNKEYSISKESCQKMIGDKVCSNCGEPIVPLETVDNAHNPTFWAGCHSCSRFDWGVSRKVFEMGKLMVVKKNYEPYTHLEHYHGKDGAYKDYWLKAQTGGAVDTVLKVLSVQKEVEEQDG